MMREEKPNKQDKYADFDQHNEMLYSYDESGFKTRVGKHNDNEQELIRQAWDVYAERIEAARQRVISGEVSPIVFFMERDLLDPSLLSSHVGIATWRVKRHFKPSVFNRLNDKLLRRYAEAFKVTVDELKSVK